MGYQNAIEFSLKHGPNSAGDGLGRQPDTRDLAARDPTNPQLGLQPSKIAARLIQIFDTGRMI